MLELCVYIRDTQSHLTQMQHSRNVDEACKENEKGIMLIQTQPSYSNSN